MGNRTKRTDKSTNEVMEYRWDIRDRLTGITVKNDLGEIIRTAEYTYDVYNQRIAKTVDTDGDGSLAAVTERFVYGSDQNIALVFDENGNVNHRYLFGDGVDLIEADESNGNVRWALTDHLGSVRDVVDDSGTVLNHIVYDAFGGVTSQSDESVVFRYGYTARELDSESGLQYNRARYFDPVVGRFISEDRIGFGGGDTNLYRYVRNNPVSFYDPFGLWGSVVSQSRTMIIEHSNIMPILPFSYPSSTVINIQGILPFGSNKQIGQTIFPPQTTAYNIPGFSIVQRQSYSNNDPNAQIATTSLDKVKMDLTEATIEYSDIEPRKGTVEPLGGLYTNYRSDQRGHIIPRELGGRKEPYNFFSQNASINQGGYRDFGADVRRYLDNLHKNCTNGVKASVNLTVNLQHNAERGVSGYPLRPDTVFTTALFSDGKMINGWFTNTHNIPSLRGMSFDYNRIPR